MLLQFSRQDSRAFRWSSGELLRCVFSVDYFTTTFRCLDEDGPHYSGNRQLLYHIAKLSSTQRVQTSASTPSSE